MYQRGEITNQAKRLGIRPKTLLEKRRKKRQLVIPQYTEMELFLLENFDYKHCAKIITHKSINALKIKQWRMKRTK